MHLRRIIKLSALAVAVAFIVAVQRDTFIRQWLIAKPVAADGRAQIVRVYDMVDLLPEKGEAVLQISSSVRSVPGGTLPIAPADARQAALQEIHRLLSERVLPTGSVPTVKGRVRSGSEVIAFDRRMIVIGNPPELQRVHDLLRQWSDPQCHYSALLRDVSVNAAPVLYGHYDVPDPPDVVEDAEPPLAALQTRLSYFSAGDGTVDQVLRLLARATGLRMDQSPQSVAGIRISRIVAIDCTVEMILDKIRARFSDWPLAIDVVDGSVGIVPQADLRKSRYSRLYRVEDLPISSKNELMALVMTIAPETWQAHHGLIGGTVALRDHIIISQTRENHRHIRALLNDLRTKPLKAAENAGARE